MDYRAHVVAAVHLGLVALLLAVFWLRPLWMLTLYRRAGLFELAGRIPVPGVADAVKLLGDALLIPWLTRQPRVLDAWIAGQRSRWEKLFRQEDVVERLRYYPLPLRRTGTGERIKAPAPLHFRADLEAPRLLMQVVGPGGAGKSSIAAQLGNWALAGQLTKHRLVPVWLDEDIDDLGAWLLRRVRAVSADDGLPDDAMIEAAKVVARVELGDDFRPKRVPKTQVVAALKDAGFGDGRGPLQRLLDNQVPEQRDTGGTTLVAFALDPIAEYVGAFAHAEICAADEACWKALRKRVEQSGEGSSGFAEALRVTREVFADELGWAT